MSDTIIRIAVDSSKAVSGARDAERSLDSLGRQASSLDKQLHSMSRGVSSIGGAFTLLKGAVAAVAMGALAKQITDVNVKFQNMHAQLQVATGSAEEAGKAMKALQEFAAKTPFTLEGATQGFIKLKNMGLDPSQRALLSYGNTAAAMGKSLDQMVEAVADAATGEFERLKEFGIKTAKEGDKVKFTFQGTTTTVKNSSEEIQKYLLGLGENQFAGGMELQAKTIGGAFANLADDVENVVYKFGEAGFSKGLSSVIRALGDGVTASGDFAESLGEITGRGLERLAEGIKASQAAFSAWGAETRKVGDLNVTNSELMQAAFLTAKSVAGDAFKSMMESFEWAGEGIFAALKSLKDAFDNNFLGIKSLTLGTLGILVDGFGTSFKMIGAIVSTFFHAFAESLNGIRKNLTDFTDRMGKLMSGDFNAFKGFKVDFDYTETEKGMKRIEEIAENGKKKISDVLSNAVDGKLGGTLGEAAKTYEQHVKEIVKNRKEQKKTEEGLVDLGKYRVKQGEQEAEQDEKSAKAAQKRNESLEQAIKELEHQAEIAGLAADEQERLNTIYQLQEKAGRKLNAIERERVENALALKNLMESVAKTTAEITKMAQKPLFEAGDLKSLREKYNPEQALKNEYLTTSRQLGELWAKNQIGLDEYKTMQANVDKEYAEAQRKIANEYREAHYDAISDIANAFGGKMGSAVNNVVDILRSVSDGSFNGTQLGGKLGGIAGLITQFTGGKDGAFAKSVGGAVQKAFSSDTFKNPMKSMKEGFDKFKGVFSGKTGLTEVAGGAFAGAQQGQMVGGIMSALGAKTSNLGSQIGGALGSIYGPIGSMIGGALGGLVGGAFKKTPKASTTASTNALGQIDIGEATGSKKLKDTVAQMAQSFEGSLKNMQQMLGADIGANINLGSIGARGKKFTFDPTGTGQTKAKKGAIKFDTAEEAIEYAIKNALENGILVGISDFSARVLKAAEDMDRATELAGKYETILDILDEYDDPVGAAAKKMGKEFAQLRKEMEYNGATAAELANVERYYTIQREKALESVLSDLKSLQERLNGKDGGATDYSLLNKAMIEFADYERKIASGQSIDQEKFAELGGKILDYAKSVYGTTTGQFQDIKERLSGSVDKAIQNATTQFDTSYHDQSSASLQADATAAQKAQLVEQQKTNQMLSGLPAQIAAALEKVFNKTMQVATNGAMVGR